MIEYEKEVVYTMRSPQGMITDVFDPKTNKYLKVVDTAITIESSESDKIEESIKAYKLRKGGG